MELLGNIAYFKVNGEVYSFDQFWKLLNDLSEKDNALYKKDLQIYNLINNLAEKELEIYQLRKEVNNHKINGDTRRR